MQKIRIAAVGKLKESFWKEGVAEYVKRLSRFADVEIKELPERNSLEEEGKDILSACRGYVIALAVEGKKLTSDNFAALMKKKADEGAEMTFVIGSSCGLCSAVKQSADMLLSFSDFTFPHQLMRVILCEQIYRAFMINSGSVYHK